MSVCVTFVNRSEVLLFSVTRETQTKISLTKKVPEQSVEFFKSERDKLTVHCELFRKKTVCTKTEFGNVKHRENVGNKVKRRIPKRR